MNKVIKLTLGILSLLVLWGCTDSEFSSQGCVDGDCPITVTAQSFSWDEGSWGDCSLACGGGTQTKSVKCMDNNKNIVPDAECTGVKPTSSRSCHAQACASEYGWNEGVWGTCSKTCGGGLEYRTVRCQSTKTGVDVSESYCSSTKPSLSRSCNTQSCPADTYSWIVGDWDADCSERCGGKMKNRSVTCQNAQQVIVADSNCSASNPKPNTQYTCTNACTNSYSWTTGTWGSCTKTCGTGEQKRSIGCISDKGLYVPHTLCTAAQPEITKACNTQACAPTCTTKQISETVSAAENQLDILLVVDDSGSMYQDNARLATKLSGFVNHLQSSNINWQMCVTSTDVDYFQGRPIQWQNGNGHILTKNSGNLYSIFTSTMKWIGAGFSSDEQGIKAMNLSIQDNGRSNCYRANAALAVIVISDEDERSVGGKQSLNPNQYKPLGALNTPQSFINTVKSNFPSGKRVSVNSIIVKDSQCKAQQDAQGEMSFYGSKYQELSNLTGGGVGSICEPNFSVCLDNFYSKITESMNEITITCSPKQGSLNIKVNGLDYTGNTSMACTKSLPASCRVSFNPVIEGPANVTGSYCCQNK